MLRAVPECYFCKKSKKTWIKIFGMPLLNTAVGSYSAFRAENKQSISVAQSWENFASSHRFC